MAIEKRTIDGVELGYDTEKREYFALPEKAPAKEKTSGNGGDGTPKYDKMNKTELLAIASEKGLTATEENTKNEIIEMITGAE